MKALEAKVKLRDEEKKNQAAEEAARAAEVAQLRS